MVEACAERKGEASVPGGGSTVLIIDDNPVNVRLLESMLKMEGMVPLAAMSGPDGRQLAGRSSPDIILLDIMMPGESGFDACRLLKADPRTAGIPVIFLSAVSDAGSKARGLGLGAVDYITKPFNKVEVLARIRRHLETRDVYEGIIVAQAERLRQIREAQQAILLEPEDLPAAGFGVRYIPVLEAGGDFYDVFPAGEDAFGYLVADISGHDIKASCNTFALKALISQNAGSGAPPEETMQVVNEVFTRLMKDGEHLTACFAQLDRRRARLTVVSAGHPPVLYLPAGGGVKVLESAGDILGAFERVSFEPAVEPVRRGERFFLYTDGLIERFGERARSREEGLQELMEGCRRTRALPIGEAVREIAASLFPDREALQDDVLILGVQI